MTEIQSEAQIQRLLQAQSASPSTLKPRSSLSAHRFARGRFPEDVDDDDDLFGGRSPDSSDSDAPDEMEDVGAETGDESSSIGVGSHGPRARSSLGSLGAFSSLGGFGVTSRMDEATPPPSGMPTPTNGSFPHHRSSNGGGNGEHDYPTLASSPIVGSPIGMSMSWRDSGKASNKRKAAEEVRFLQVRSYHCSHCLTRHPSVQPISASTPTALPLSNAELSPRQPCSSLRMPSPSPIINPLPPVITAAVSSPPITPINPSQRSPTLLLPIYHPLLRLSLSLHRQATRFICRARALGEAAPLRN